MRNHGWELPYHPLQTVAIAVFAGLSFSFYVFFIPFVGSSILKFHIYAAFTPVVIAVFVLYVRCAACDPADRGVHQSKRALKAKKEAALRAKVKVAASNETGLEQSPDGYDKSLSSILPSKNEVPSHGRSVCGQWLCLPFSCCRKDQHSEKLNVGEQLLYCSICEAEISKNSKHCRACDKCVHGFDHHCRWLNNCVGTRNYRIFVALMVSCLLLLVTVWVTGIAVLVRCFSNRRGFEKEIVARLGSSFSQVPYVIVVGLLSLLAILATAPLVQLFCFHLILIHKGITTYDYILAVREQEQEQEQETGEGEGFNSLTSSPASSTATGVSGYSSAGALALQRGVFCTPPRMFVEHQQSVLSISGDLESGAKTSKGLGGVTQQSQKKVPVGINPWKLARINAEEATRAAARAREASSIIRPSRCARGPSQVTETEESSLESSCSVSGEITVARSKRGRRKHDIAPLSGKERWLLMKERRDKNISLNGIGPHVHGGPQTIMVPLPIEARNAFRCSPSRFSGELKASYPGSSYPGSSYPGTRMASPDMFQESPDPRVPPQVLLESSPIAVKEVNNVVSLPRCGSDGYEASAGESGDEKTERPGQVLKKSNLDQSFVTPTEKVSVWEDCSGENMMPRTSLDSRSLGSRGSRSSKAESSGGRTESSGGSRAEANILKHVKKEWPEVRDGLSVSPDNSHESSPTHYNSPQRDSIECPSTVTTASNTTTPTKTEPAVLDEESTSTIVPEKRFLLSTKKLKETLLALRRSNTKAHSEGPEQAA